MKSSTLYIYFFIVIFFVDCYLGVSWMMFSSIANYFLLIVFLFKKNIKIKANKIYLPFLLFLLYIFLINILQNDILDAISLLIPFIPLPLIFYFLYESNNNNRIIYIYSKTWLILNFIFCILQFFNFHIILSDVSSLLPFVGRTYNFASDFSLQGLRVSGITYSTIGFSSHLGMIFFYFFYNRNNMYSKKMRLIYLLMILFLIFMTQTRSLIFLVFPILIINKFLFSKKGFLSQARNLIFLIPLTFGLTLLFSEYLQVTFPRLFLTIESDGSIVHRIQSNVFAVIGTFYTSPIIGVPFDDALEMMNYGFSKIGLFVGDYFIDEVTHHNQILYYFRYYGFIGLIFLIYIYYKMIIIALLSKSNEIKKIILSVVFFHFFYTLSHNNTIFTDYFLWIFLSLKSPAYNYITKFNGTK